MTTKTTMMKKAIMEATTTLQAPLLLSEVHSFLAIYMQQDNRVENAWIPTAAA
jgi:hypothetical protein